MSILNFDTQNVNTDIESLLLLSFSSTGKGTIIMKARVFGAEYIS